MAFQESVAVRNAKLNAEVTAIGASPVLKLFSGAQPANCAASDPSGLLATINLPATFMNAASGGAMTLAGSWAGTGSANGTIASWRIYETTATTCHYQGDTTIMTFSNTNIANGQAVSVTSFTVTAGNA